MDSGASRHFTHELSDFTEYRPIKDGAFLTTAKKGAPLQIKGEGTVILTYEIVDNKGMYHSVTTCFYPVYYVPGMSTRLLSMGDLLVNGYTVHADMYAMNFYKGSSRISASRKCTVMRLG